MTETTTHQRTAWKYNGKAVKIPGGVWYPDATRAKACCTCGWQGTWFPTRNVEYFTVVGEREFDAHASAWA